MASDWVSTSPELSLSAGTRICGLMARYSGLRFCPPSFWRWIGNGLEGEVLEIERDAHPVGRGRAEIGIELHGDPHPNQGAVRDRPAADVQAWHSGFAAKPCVGGLHGQLSVAVHSVSARLWRQARRSVGQQCHGAVEGGAVGSAHGFGQFLGEVAGARRKLLVDRAAGRGQRQEGLPQVGAVGFAGDEFAAPRAGPPRAKPWSCAYGYGRRWPCRSSPRTGPGSPGPATRVFQYRIS